MNYILSKQSLNLELPIEAIKYRIEQMQLKQKDLIHYIGNKSKGNTKSKCNSLGMLDC